jgi:hypothetical protein
MPLPSECRSRGYSLFGSGATIVFLPTCELDDRKHAKLVTANDPAERH